MFTKGPWVHEKMLLGAKDKDRRSGFVVNGPDTGSGPLPIRVCDIRTSNGYDYKTAKDTASLIAAAPDLYEALEPFAKFIDAFEAKPLSNISDEVYCIHAGTEWEASIKRSDCVKARDAIRKAKGE